MSATFNRLQTIIDNAVTTKVVFRAEVDEDKGGASIVFEAVPTSQFYMKQNDDKLQEAISEHVCERWDATTGTYHIDATPYTLLERIQSTVTREYERFSDRCKATKRKTEHFILDIKFENYHLMNFLVQMYIDIKSPSWDDKTRQQKQAHLETFESLRRVYGKQQRR